MAVVALAVSLLAAAALGPRGEPGPQASATAATGGFSLPPIRHVWVIALENSSWLDGAAHNSPMNTPGISPYLREVLRKRGNTLTNYWGVAHNSQPNYIAMVSGQGPSPPTQDDCDVATNNQQAGEWSPQPAVEDTHGQLIGSGCYFPSNVKTLYNQLDDNHLTWKEYQEDLGNQPGLDGYGGPCPYNPNNGAGTVDRYAAKHDPAQWFHAVVDNQAACRAKDLPLYRLADDLQSVKTTANFNFISGNLDSDGHQGNFSKTADPWLRQYVAMIMSSPAYRQDGMIFITFDESDTLTGVPNNNPTHGDTDPEDTDSDANRSCCGEIPGPNSPSPGIAGDGGGRTGTLVLSPFVKPGSSSDTPYNHYSFLRSMEDLFGITTGGNEHGHLGFAGSYGPEYPGPGSFGADVYNAASPPSSGAGGSPSGGPTGPRPSDGSTAWEHPRPQGNDVDGVDCPSAGTCVAVGDHGSILKTTDGGDDWSILSSDILTRLARIDCASGSACVAVGDSGTIVRTSDGGANWSRADAGTAADLTDVACPSTTTCYAVGAGGAALKSTDGGQSWSAQQSGVDVGLNGISCPSEVVCYAVGDTAKVKTSTGTTTLGQIVATTDGSTWSTRKSGTSDRISDISCATATNCLAAADRSYVRTTNGAAWTPSFPGAIINAVPFAVTCPTDQSCLTAGMIRASSNNASSEPGVAFVAGTANAGATFTAQHAGVASALRDVSCLQPTTCVAVGARGTILKTSDTGAQWTLKTPGAESDLTRMVCTNKWQCLNEGVDAVQGMSCPDSATCVAVGNYGTIMATQDGGNEWADQVSGTPQHSGNADPPLTPPILNGVSCSTSSRCVAVGDVGSEGHASVKATTDGGTSWHDGASNTSQDLLAVSCPDASVCLATGANGGIAKTTDGGGTWHESESGVGNPLSSISCADASTCVAVGSLGTVLRTSDVGDHWTQTDSGTNAYLSGVSCHSRELCVAVGSGGTVLRITGAGQQASERPSGVGDDLMAVSCSSQTHCVGTGSDGTVISTATGGNDWDVQGTGTAWALRAASCPATDHCMAGGDAGAVLGVTPTAKPGRGEGSKESAGQGLRDALGSACVASSPRTSILRRGLKLTRRSVRIAGRAAVHDCASNRLSRVQVGVARVVPRGCRFLRRNGRLGKRRSCRRPVYQLARVRGATWTFSKSVRLPLGRYRMLVRGRDSAGRPQARVLQRAISLRR